VPELSKEEFMAHMGPMREDIAELVKLWREQNGRVSKAETRIAILEDRSPKREAIGISAIVSAVVNGIAMWVGSQK
jgi:hypothetical protein